MRELTDPQLIIELRALRTHLDPVLNARMKNVLSEVEKRLTKGYDKKQPKPTGSMTKEQILNKWLNKY